MYLLSFLYFFLSFSEASASSEPARRQDASIPDYVFTYAPLVYLDVNDPYLPSDIGAQITHTYPEANFTRLSNVAPNLSLSNLATLNALGQCTSFSDPPCDLYLTSRDNIVTTHPAWLKGVYPNPSTGATEDATSAAVIVNDHGDGTVDAFYMYFYAYNLGLEIFGSVQGNHVGDWEHTMVRFMNGMPVAVWYSQHDAGETWSYSALEKGGQGMTRPVVYSGLGGHASYATSGVHTRDVSVVTLNDTTSKGPLWDPLLGAYFYTFTPDSSGSNGTFTPVDPPSDYQTGLNNPAPVSWLYYLGRWGDKQYPDNAPGQVNLANLSISWAYEDGPTGPLDKQLQRDGTCPDSDAPCTTLTQLPPVIGPPATKTITRSYVPPSPTMTTGGGGSGGGGGASPSGSSGGSSPTQTGAASPRMGELSSGVAGMGALLSVMNLLGML